MSTYAQLIFWITLLSSTITYVWWTYFRVQLLRDDLFELRNHLWDQMRLTNGLHSRWHCETRDGINAMIRAAPWLSLVGMAGILFGGTHSEVPEDEPPPEEINEVRRALFRRLLHFLMYETLSGIVVMFVARIYLSYHNLERQLVRWIGRLFDSREIREMEGVRNTHPVDPCYIAGGI